MDSGINSEDWDDSGVFYPGDVEIDSHEERILLDITEVGDRTNSSNKFSQKDVSNAFDDGSKNSSAEVMREKGGNFSYFIRNTITPRTLPGIIYQTLLQFQMMKGINGILHDLE